MTLDSDTKYQEILSDGLTLSMPGQLLDFKLAFVSTKDKQTEATTEESKNGDNIHGVVYYLKQKQFEALKAILKDVTIKKGWLKLYG